MLPYIKFRYYSYLILFSTFNSNFLATQAKTITVQKKEIHYLQFQVQFPNFQFLKQHLFYPLLV